MFYKAGHPGLYIVGVGRFDVISRRQHATITAATTNAIINTDDSIRNADMINNTSNNDIITNWSITK